MNNENPTDHNDKKLNLSNRKKLGRIKSCKFAVKVCYFFQTFPSFLLNRYLHSLIRANQNFHLRHF